MHPVLFRLLLLLTIVPLVELVILIRIAKWIHWQSTIALVIITGIIGAWLARREGIKTLTKIQTDLQSGAPPASALVDGVLILIAGAFLVTPGIITDCCGFALLIPTFRNRIRNRLAASFKAHIVSVHHGGIDPFIDIQASGTDAEDVHPPQA